MIQVLFLSYQKPQDFSYENMSVTSSLPIAMALEQGMDKSTYSSGFASFSDHVMYGCEDNARTQPAESEEPAGFLHSTSSHIRRFSSEQYGILSPEIKLVPLKGNICHEHNAKRTLPYNESAKKRKSSISTKGDLLVKIEDVREKLKPCASGGLTVVTSSAKERYTSSG